MDSETQLVEREEETISPNKEASSKPKNSKAASQGNPKRGSYGQLNRKEYHANSWWSGSGRNRNNNKKGNRSIGASRSNSHANSVSESSKMNDATQLFDDTNKRSCQGRPPTSKATDSANGSGDYKHPANVGNNRLDESKRRSERARFHKNSHYKGVGSGGAGGGPSKGIPPPGISELHRDARSQATS